MFVRVGTEIHPSSDHFSTDAQQPEASLRKTGLLQWPKTEHPSQPQPAAFMGSFVQKSDQVRRENRCGTTEPDQTLHLIWSSANNPRINLIYGVQFFI